MFDYRVFILDGLFSFKIFELFLSKSFPQQSDKFYASGNSILYHLSSRHESVFKEESESEEESEDKQPSKSKYDLMLTDDKV